jgi:hypothetical protein
LKLEKQAFFFQKIQVLVEESIPELEVITKSNNHPTLGKKTKCFASKDF